MIATIYRAYEHAVTFSRRHRALVTIASLALFAITVAVALAHLPIKLVSLDPKPLLLVLFVLAPCTLAINTWRIRASARALSTHAGIWTSMRMALLSSAANLLPIPGAAIVRVGHIAGGDSGKLGRAAGLTLGSLMLALACGFGGLAASAYLQAGQTMIALSGAATSCGLAVVAAYWLARRAGASLALELALVEVASIATESARLWACLLALKVAIPFAAAVALSLNTTVGGVVAVAPGGLGIRELVGASVAAAISLSAAGTVIAIAINRLLDLVFMGLTLGLTGMRKPSR